MGQSFVNERTCLYFLDEMSLSAAQQVDLSHLKMKTRPFLDQGLPLSYLVLNNPRALLLSPYERHASTLAHNEATLALSS